MLLEYLPKLKSLNRSDRMQAWTELHNAITTAQVDVSKEDVRQLQRVLGQERDEDVWRHGTTVMHGVTVEAVEALQKSPKKKQSTSEPQPLITWLWGPFHRKSAVFGVTQDHVGRRDDDALLHLARRLGYVEFPHTHFDQSALEQDDWLKQVFDKDYESICLVGRIGLFGEEAERTIVNPNSRFDFPESKRPDSLDHLEVHPRYHCIRANAGGETIEYPTTLDKGVRTDFGLIKRFPIKVGESWIHVVHCAGSSSLGTWAAARFAAFDLARPQSVADQFPIPSPKGINAKSTMEALVRTSADNSISTWRPNRIELVRLYVDNWLWSSDDLEWQNLKPREVKLVRKEGSPDTLLLDGQKAKMNPNKGAHRLAVALVERALKSKDGVVLINDLLNDKQIWCGEEVDTKKVRNRLHMLNNRQFCGVLSIKGNVRVDAKVLVEEEK